MKKARLNPLVLDRYNITWLSELYLLSKVTSLTEKYFRTVARLNYKKSVAPCNRDKDVLPDTGKAWRFCKIEGAFYYAYANIPVTYRNELPTETELKTLAFETGKSEDNTLSKFFDLYSTEIYKDYLPLYADCTPVQQKSLAIACARLQGCVEYLTKNNICIKANEFFIEVAELAQLEDWKYFPHNYRIIKRDKVLPVYNHESAITDLIKLPRAANDNATQYNEAEVKSWVLQLRAMGENFTNIFIIRKIYEMCLLNEKPQPSERWIGQIMQQHNVKYLTASQRFGENGRFANKYRGYVPLANALFAGDCWQVDATRFNIIAHKAEDKKQRFLDSVCIRDVYSGDIVGSEFDYSENRWVYTSALHQAVNNCGYLPYSIVFDKFPGHNSEEFTNLIADLETRGVKIIWTSRSTGKARIERHFSTMQTVFMMESSKYYGEGIKSRNPFAHRSEKALKAMIRQATAEGYDLFAARTEAERIITKYRDTALNEYSRKYSAVTKSPRQLHELSEKPNVKPVTEAAITYLFGLRKQLQITNQGYLKTEINKVPFVYFTKDTDIISRYPDVMVCYNMDDLSFCHMYEISDKPLKKYLGKAAEFVLPQAYGPQAEVARIEKQKAIIKQIETKRLEELELAQAVGYDITPLLMPGFAPKHAAQSAESEYMNKAHSAPASSFKIAPKQVRDDFKNSVDIDVRNQY